MGSCVMRFRTRVNGRGGFGRSIKAGVDCAFAKPEE